MKLGPWVLPLLVIALMAAFFRPTLDVDVFNLLPRDSETVQGLQTYQENFGSASEVLLLVQGPDPAATRDAASALASELLAGGLAVEAIWQAPTQLASEDLGELLAYLWFNQPSGAFDDLAAQFTDDGMNDRLAQALEKMALSFQPLEVAELGRDPFGLGAIRQTVALPVSGPGADPFASADGRSRLVIVTAPDAEGGFLVIRRWVAELNGFLERWIETHPDVSVGVTGNPAFVAESGNALLGDLLGAALGTALLVAALFWLVHRRWQPLVALVVLLAVVLGITAVVGNLLFGGLHAVSLGFAAILLGLAADYGLILYQEARSHPELGVPQQRRAVLPAIGWSAITTAGAFFMISRSSLPGLSQLGILVGFGVLLAALVMLTSYLPLAGRSGAGRREQPEPGWSKLGSRKLLWGGAAALGMALLVTVSLPPQLNSDARSLALNAGSARATLDAVRTRIGGFDDDHWLLLTGRTTTEVGAKLMAAESLLAAAQERGTLDGYRLPTGVWPQSGHQQANRATLVWLADRQAATSQALAGAGFTDASLTAAVFQAWRRFSLEDEMVWPQSAGTAWLVRQFAATTPDQVAALGRLRPAEDATVEAVATLGDDVVAADAGQLVSWTLLARSLLGAVERDLTKVLVPMTVVLLLLLSLAFRGAGGVVLSVAALAASLLGLLAVMSLVGWQWNLMNVMALPMLFGAGVDYALHMQFAMRRYRGDAARARNSVGRAIMLCAASTAAGFATLGFADNAGIASLGQVCAVGIVITCGVCVFLLPVWWRIMPGHLAKETS